MKTIARDQNGRWHYVTDTEKVWFSTLCQVLQAEPREMPFYANYGLPTQNSVMTQIMPDFFMAQMQTVFSTYFPFLSITRAAGYPDMTYEIKAVLTTGEVIEAVV